MELDDAEYQLKPMNCPFHILIYADRQRSYRDLPVRLGELGTVYRYERSGVLHGLLRVRGFTQDDAHIFCTPEQIEDEVVDCLQFAIDTLTTFGFEKYEAELSTWDGGASGKYDGTPEQWELAESALRRGHASGSNIKAKVMPDEAAFYGPKIDVKLVDAIGRLWQLSTVQFDFTLPRRFGLEYIAEDGKAHQPLMVHRALYGSIERFFGILIEHYAGAFPVWLAPVQAIVLPITDRQIEYARSVQKQLDAAGIRAHRGRAQREGQPQDPRGAVAEDPVHAGGGRSRAGERPGGGAQPQARRPGREAAGGLHRRDSRADRVEGRLGVARCTPRPRAPTRYAGPVSGVSRRGLLSHRLGCRSRAWESARIWASATMRRTGLHRRADRGRRERHQLLRFAPSTTAASARSAASARRCSGCSATRSWSAPRPDS